MTHALTLRQAGGSICVTLPKAIVDKYKFKAGDKAFLTDTDDGMMVTPHDADVEEMLTLVAETSREYRNAFRELSKR